jgi:hypothetical protein
MSEDIRPGAAFEKDDGKWTFYVYPKGVQQEADEYTDAETAREWADKALRHWYTNGGTYGSLWS